MMVPLSKRCGKETCPHYTEEKLSCCKIYVDRKMCPVKITDKETYNKRKKWS